MSGVGAAGANAAGGRLDVSRPPEESGNSHDTGDQD